VDQHEDLQELLVRLNNLRDSMEEALGYLESFEDDYRRGLLEAHIKGHPKRDRRANNRACLFALSDGRGPGEVWAPLVAEGVREVWMTEHHDRQTMERLRNYLSRADSELRDAQHFLNPESAEEVEIDIVHAVAAARLALANALERVRSRLGEPEP